MPVELLAGVPFGTPLTGHTGSVLSGSWGTVAGRPVLATGDGDGTVRLWDPVSGGTIGTPLTGHIVNVWWGSWGTVAVSRCWPPATGTGPCCCGTRCPAPRSAPP